jgi:sugar lactone lactonase YvrE/enterochelin esterase-like enzyme
VCVLAATSVHAADDYEPGPDSKPQDGVPMGEVIQFKFEQSKIYPGTTRDYWVYVPAQYKPETPACVYVAQDGVQHEAPVVFDNLIHRKEMPVTVGVFVRPGVVKAANPDQALDRFNRSFEYDSLGDAYVRFLVEELLPDVETKKASDGRAIRLSKSGNDRAIGGQSSGGICAFTAAWERPDEFSRVFSAIGTFVDLRGGMRYPTLIRKYEPKPIRVFLQDGSADNNSSGGDWWMANQTMERALTFAGYEVNHAWGDGGHTSKHGTAIFPDVMRYLWKDWPQPVKNGPTGNRLISSMLIAGEGWQLVGEGYGFTEGPAVNARGEVFFNDIPNSKTYKVDLEGKVVVFDADSKRANGQHFNSDGRRYSLSGEQTVLAYDSTGQATVVADQIRGNDLVIAHNGNVYVTHPTANTQQDPSKVWLIKPDGSKQIVDTGIRFPNGVTLSPDQTQLYVTDFRSHWVYSFMVQPDGTLAHKQRYVHLHVPDTAEDAWPDGVRCDRQGRLYIATNMGIQVSDPTGKINAILPTPNGKASNVCFGGENFDMLFATCGDKVYKRKVKVQGANAWDKPIKPATPRL